MAQIRGFSEGSPRPLLSLLELDRADAVLIYICIKAVTMIQWVYLVGCCELGLLENIKKESFPYVWKLWRATRKFLSISQNAMCEPLTQTLLSRHKNCCNGAQELSNLCCVFPVHCIRTFAYGPAAADDITNCSVMTVLFGLLRSPDARLSGKVHGSDAVSDPHYVRILVWSVSTFQIHMVPILGAI